MKFTSTLISTRILQWSLLFLFMGIASIHGQSTENEPLRPYQKSDDYFSKDLFQPAQFNLLLTEIVQLSSRIGTEKNETKLNVEIQALKHKVFNLIDQIYNSNQHRITRQDLQQLNYFLTSTEEDERIKSIFKEYIHGLLILANKPENQTFTYRWRYFYNKSFLFADKVSNYLTDYFLNSDDSLEVKCQVYDKHENLLMFNAVHRWLNSWEEKPLEHHDRIQQDGLDLYRYFIPRLIRQAPSCWKELKPKLIQNKSKRRFETKVHYEELFIVYHLFNYTEEHAPAIYTDYLKAIENGAKIPLRLNAQVLFDALDSHDRETSIFAEDLFVKRINKETAEHVLKLATKKWDKKQINDLLMTALHHYSNFSESTKAVHLYFLNQAKESLDRQDFHLTRLYERFIFLAPSNSELLPFVFTVTEEDKEVREIKRKNILKFCVQQGVSSVYESLDPPDQLKLVEVFSFVAPHHPEIFNLMIQEIKKENLKESDIYNFLMYFKRLEDELSLDQWSQLKPILLYVGETYFGPITDIPLEALITKALLQNPGWVSDFSHLLQDLREGIKDYRK